MTKKTSRAIIFLAMGLTLTAAMLSIIGMSITGFYPGIMVLCALTLIPIVSWSRAKRTAGDPSARQGRYTLVIGLVNLLVILVVLWMSFVIVHDRVLGDV